MTASRLPPSVLTVALLVGLAVLLVAGPVRATGLPAPGSGVWPLQPRPPVVAAFEAPASRYAAGHRGVDLAGRVGQPVHTALAGRVSFAGRLAGRGVVVVDHGGTRTTYEPVAAVVHVGDEVATGAVLGRLELFSSHCFPRACLHWGLIEGAEHYLDPLTLVGAAPVRLLPLFTALPPAPLPGLSPPPLAPLLRPWAFSGPGVGLPVGPPQSVGGDVGVDLGGGQ